MRTRCQGDQPEAHGDAESHLIPPLHGVEAAFQRAVCHAVAGLVIVLEEAAAEHRREGQRDETGNQDGDHDGDRELVQQAADDAAHEEHRNEHGDQREGHGENREADLRDALMAASRRVSPISMWRTMFSSMTMASSTTKPTESVSAMSDRLLRL